MATPMNPELQRQFMYLFERVGEPLYFGNRYNLAVDMCPETAHASTIRKQGFISQRNNEIKVDRPSRMPDLSRIGHSCSKSALYNYFNPNHRRAVRELREILIQQPNLKDLLSMSCACRDNDSVNNKVWINALASCLINRPDTKGFRMPAIWEIMPDMFFSPYCLKEAVKQGSIPQQDRALIVVDRNFSGRDSNPENRLSYFREDLGVNAHHWHWHLIYTLEAPRGERDRKGELFYYMHHEMLARYEAERLANGLPRTKVMILDERFVKEGYFPKLTESNSSQLWGNRQQETKLNDINRIDDISLPEGYRVVTLEMIKKYRNRILEAIDTGTVLLPGGKTMPLNIDILGDIVEASSLNPNPQYYGDLHNLGHVILAFAHDPEFKHRENMGVLGDTVGAMRDPVFYRWHKYIDDMFDRHKQNLQPYSPTGGDFPLAWQGVIVESVQVLTEKFGSQPNMLTTFRMKSNIDLSRGMDFYRTQNNLGPVFVRVEHLNHDPFNYTIKVRNDTKSNRYATVRIFLAPRLNEHNQQFPMVQQRRLFFQLDKFTTQLIPGTNTINRKSSESTVTVPWEQTFRELERTMTTPDPTPQTFCGCGWPQHLLIPRGTVTGQLFDLVVFLTNGSEDTVMQKPPQGAGSGCRDSVSYCGILDQLYPDKKPMGYPFDRNPYTTQNPNDPNGVQQPVMNLEAYLTRIPNMKATQVRIMYDQARVQMKDDGVPAGMREINGDPLAAKGRGTACDPVRPNQTSPAGSPARPSSMEMSPPRSPSPSKEPWEKPPSRPSTAQPSRPQSQYNNNWGNRQPNQWEGSPNQYYQKPKYDDNNSRSPSPTGWTHIPSPGARPSSPKWGWGWQG